MGFLDQFKREECCWNFLTPKRSKMVCDMRNVLFGGGGEVFFKNLISLLAPNSGAKKNDGFIHPVFW